MGVALTLFGVYQVLLSHFWCCSQCCSHLVCCCAQCRSHLVGRCASVALTLLGVVASVALASLCVVASVSSCSVWCCTNYCSHPICCCTLMQRCPYSFLILCLSPTSRHFKVDENFNRVDGPKTAQFSGEKVVLNHYVLKSLADFNEKSARGSGDGGRKPLHFFHNMDKAMNANCTDAVSLMKGRVSNLESSNFVASGL